VIGGAGGTIRGDEAEAGPLGGPGPVTAKLSLKFYEKLGEEVANELMEWFNQVDASWRNDLREWNELNFTRFDAKLDHRLAELGAELRTEFHREIAAVRVDLIKWYVGLWVPWPWQ
jgi:hypothetical protein